MVPRFIGIILLTFVAQAHAEVWAANCTSHAHDYMDRLVNKLISQLIDKLVDPQLKAWPLRNGPRSSSPAGVLRSRFAISHSPFHIARSPDLGLRSQASGTRLLPIAHTWRADGSIFEKPGLLAKLVAGAILSPIWVPFGLLDRSKMPYVLARLQREKNDPFHSTQGGKLAQQVIELEQLVTELGGASAPKIQSEAAAEAEAEAARAGQAAEKIETVVKGIYDDAPCVKEENVVINNLLLPVSAATCAGIALAYANLAGIPGAVPGTATLLAATAGGAPVESIFVEALSAGTVGAAAALLFPDAGPAGQTLAVAGLSTLAAFSAAKALTEPSSEAKLAIEAADEARAWTWTKYSNKKTSGAAAAIQKAAAARLEAAIEGTALVRADALLLPAAAAGVLGAATAAATEPAKVAAAVTQLQVAGLTGLIPGFATLGAIGTAIRLGNADTSSLIGAAKSAAEAARAAAAAAKIEAVAARIEAADAQGSEMLAKVEALQQAADAAAAATLADPFNPAAIPEAATGAEAKVRAAAAKVRAAAAAKIPTS